MRRSLHPPDQGHAIGLGRRVGNQHLPVGGKNLTDELVATYVTAFAPYRQVLVPYAPPKTYGVTLVWRM